MTDEPRIAKVRRTGGDAPTDRDATPPEDKSVPEEVAQSVASDREPGKVTPRDLRRARRKARRLGLNATDDHDALRLLREKGIDLNEGNSILEFVPPSTDLVPAEEPGLPIVPEPEHPPAAPIMDDAERAKEIERIQQGLIKRRRQRLAYLLVKLAFFIVLPTWLVGYYYFNVATEMFETHSAFAIQKSESGSSPMGGLLSGTGFANTVDSVSVQEYLSSLEAMVRLDEEEGFRAHFQQERIDDIQRLPPDATQNDAYSTYKKRVRVGFDPTEGILRLEVSAASPEASQRFSEALIRFAEERVDGLSASAREEQMRGAIEAFDKAENDVSAAQNRVVSLQTERGVLSAEVEVSATMTLINSLELEREKKMLALAEIEANARPNDTRLTVTKNEIARLRARISELRGGLTQSGDNKASLAQISGELAVAEADLMNRQLMLQTAMQQVESARIEATRQSRHLALSVTPVAPDVATYPRRFENTVLAFVIFGSLYILMSLTVSILREQVSA